jgi:ferredoxin
MGSLRVFRVTLNTPKASSSIPCAEDEFIWNAAARSGIPLPAICHQGRCLTCAARLVDGEFDQTAAASYFDEDRAAGFVLLCTALPRSDLVLETHRQSEMRAFRKAHGLPAPYA